MNIREMLEEQECMILSPYAALSKNTAGRDKPIEPCDMRTDYQRDRDRILHSKAFRRLKHKTQVFLSPEGDHYRTRLTHTLEVSQIARSISRALRLNEDLTEAIALGHDLGHTPFGHTGEEALNRVCSGGFSHTEQGLRVVEILERDGEGLNLTREVRDGILNHRTSGHPSTLEGQVVRLADKIAYINHDIDDGIRAGLLSEDTLPEGPVEVLGHSVKERLDLLIHDVIRSSMDKPEISMSPEVENAMMELREYMFASLYHSPVAKSQDSKAQNLLIELFDHYTSHPEDLPEEYLRIGEERGDSVERTACDYIAGMSDSYAVRQFEDLYIPQSWK